MKKKIALLMACIMAFGVAVGGTLAWLIDETDEVVNTFAPSTISIELDETTGEDYKMVPGDTLDKDPLVTVEAGSEACWLFVKVEKKNSFDDFMSYAIAEGWTELTKDSGIYWRKVDAAEADQEFGVLADDEVSVLDEVTKDMMDDLTEDTYPTLTFTAYAIQQASFADAAAAWAEISGT